ncbi:MAG: hypothetical protein ACKPHU_10940, partial [Planctomycetaceae bacterium]
MLHNHGIRILPTLSAPAMLRIEPSAYLSPDGVFQFVAGLREFCEQLTGSNIRGLLRHLIPPPGVSRSTGTADDRGSVADTPRSGQRLNFRFSSEPP